MTKDAPFICKVTLAMVLLFLFLSLNTVQAQQIPAGQDMGTTERRVQRAKKSKELVEKLTEKKEELEITEPGEIVPEVADEARALETKTLVSRIDVKGVTVLTESQIRAIVGHYEGRQLSISDFKEIADLISDEYRERGYVTTIAYLPPQKIENHVLVIEVLEGKLGKVEISGNKHFSERGLLKYLSQKENESFR